jgi:hypothetical protein
MTLTVEQAALRHARQLCLEHRDALLDALAGLEQSGHGHLETPGKQLSRRQPAIQVVQRFPDMAGFLR